MIEGEEYMKREEKQELSVAGKVYDGRVKKEAGRACGAWGMEDGHGHLVKEAFKAGFVQGGFYALRNQWIRVEEALPETGEDGCSRFVLARCENLVPKIAQYSDNSYTRVYTYVGMDGRKHENHWFDAYFEPLRHDITHWMEIPRLG